MMGNISIILTEDESLEQKSATVSFGISWLILSFGALGIVSNLISLIIYSRPCMRSSINVLLSGLSAIDMCVCLFSIPTFVVPSMCVYWPDTEILRTVTTYGTLYMYPLANMAQTSSVWVFVVITFERWVAVCRPFRARWSTTNRSIKALVGVCVTAVLYNMIRFFEHATARDDSVQFNQVDQLNKNGSLWLSLSTFAELDEPVCNSIQQYLRNDYYYMSVYYSGLYLITHFALPFTMLTLVNMKMIYSIHRARHERRQLSQFEKKEHRTTAMMTAVVFMFLLCNTLPFVLNLIEQMDGDVFRRPQSKLLMFTLNDISNLLVLVNASTTCFIYYSCSQKYRRLVHYYFRGFGFASTQEFGPIRQMSASSMSSGRRGFTIVGTKNGKCSEKKRKRLRRWESSKCTAVTNFIEREKERTSFREKYCRQISA